MKEIFRQFQTVYVRVLIDKCSNNRRIARLVMVSSFMFLSWLVGYKWRDAKIFIQNAQIEHLTYRRQQLIQDVSKLEQNLTDYNFMLGDGDWYRYLAYKHAQIIIPSTVNSQHLRLLTEEAVKNKIPLKYIYRLVWKESGYNKDALSNMGAESYMQMIPSSFQLFKNRNNKNISRMTKHEQNIIIGCFMLGYLHQKYGRWDLTFAAYNAGSVVSECLCVPQIAETQNYVKFIMSIDLKLD